MPEAQLIGIPVRELETPVLLVNLDAMERNLDRMAENLEGTGRKLRAHGKTHKSPYLARKQIARGAVGVCCQKVSEAEVMAEGGVENILVSSEVVSASKLRRLAALTRHTKLMVVVDHPQGAEMLSAAMKAVGSEIGGLVPDLAIAHDQCPPTVWHDYLPKFATLMYQGSERFGPKRW